MTGKRWTRCLITFLCAVLCAASAAADVSVKVAVPTATPAPGAAKTTRVSIPPALVTAVYELGSNTPEVLTIKKRMQLLGYFTAGAELTGNYNSLMQERIRMFQKDYGLEETGLIDEAFLMALYSEKANEAATDKRVEQKVAKAVSIFKNACKTGSYNAVLKRPKDYWGQKLKVRGTLYQFVKMQDGPNVLVLQETKEKSWYILTTKAEDELGASVGDRVTVYGICHGSQSYTSIGGKKMLPCIEAQYLDR